MKTSSLLSIGAAGIATAAFLLTSVAGRAQILTGFTESGTAGQSGGGNGLSAFEFTVTQAIDITDLGFFALSIGGGDTPSVAIFDVTNGLANATEVVNSGNVNSGLTNDAWNYVAVAPTLLTAGHTYAVMAVTYFSPTYASSAGFTYGAGITSETYLEGSGFGGWAAIPGSGTAGNWGSYSLSSLSVDSGTIDTPANFEYTLVAAPEPSTWAFLALGLLGCGALLRHSPSRRAVV